MSDDGIKDPFSALRHYRETSDAAIQEQARLFRKLTTKQQNELLIHMVSNLAKQLYLKSMGIGAQPPSLRQQPQAPPDVIGSA